VALGTARALLRNAQSSDDRHLNFVTREFSRHGRFDPPQFPERVKPWGWGRRVLSPGGRTYLAFSSEIYAGRGDRSVFCVQASEASLLEAPEDKVFDTRARRRRQTQFLKALRKADRIVVPTEWQRSRLMAWDRSLVRRSFVVPPAPLLERVEASLVKAPSEVASFVLEERPFILVLGDIEARSNLSLLLESLSKVEGLDLVLMGRRRGVGTEELERSIDEYATRARVLRFKECDDAGLATLFDRARAVVVCSQGLVATLPIVEALVRGRPLLLARNPDHEELAGEAALYFDPHLGRAELKEFLEAVRDDSYVRRELSERSSKRSGDYNAARMLAKLNEVFNSL
jgi:hypothetical protein